jgi:hypothetical protein
MGTNGILLQHFVRGGGLDHHDGDRVGDDVMKFTRDPSALGGDSLDSSRAFGGC